MNECMNEWMIVLEDEVHLNLTWSNLVQSIFCTFVRTECCRNWFQFKVIRFLFDRNNFFTIICCWRWLKGGIFFGAISWTIIGNDSNGLRNWSTACRFSYSFTWYRFQTTWNWFFKRRCFTNVWTLWCCRCCGCGFIWITIGGHHLPRHIFRRLNNFKLSINVTFGEWN